jgi:starch synthase
MLFGESRPTTALADTPLKICLVTAELAPLAKTGGLADVCAALARFFHASGHDVRVLMPRYASIDLSSLDVVAVDYLQDVPVRLGGAEATWSLDTVVLPGSNLPIYLLRCPALYERAGIYTLDPDEYQRFGLLSRAAIEMCQRMAFAPDIFHCHDWHAALAPLYLKSIYAWDRLFARTRSVLTLHNIGYQGVFPSHVLGDLGLHVAAHDFPSDDLAHGRINFLKTGIVHAHVLTTVSPTYAEEIQGDELGMGLQHLLRARRDSLTGILNGVDYGEWDPASDPRIPQRYTSADLRGKTTCKRALIQELGLEPAPGRPLAGMVSRLVAQKGLDLVRAVVPDLLRERDFSLAVLGSGEAQYEDFFHWLAQAFRGRVAFRRGYDEALAHRIEAGSDMFLMPSRYEPCGLNQMYSLRYGSVPIVRATGGLADSVQPFDPASGAGTGIVFRDYTAEGLRWALSHALDLYADRRTWLRLVRNGMAQDFSWERQGQRYVDLFRSLLP